MRGLYPAAQAFSGADQMSNSNGRVRAGVIGAGVFGGYHAGKYAAHERAELVGVHDIHLDRARAHVDKHGGQAFDDMDALIEACDVVTIASPAVAHYEAAMKALSAGRHVLVEKPVSETVEHAREVVEFAQKQGLVLQVGHQERFVFRAMGLFDVPSTPLRIVSRRMGPPSDRNLDVSVTLDLMVHDLDLAMALANEVPDAVTGETDAGRFGSPDVSKATLTFRNGCVAELTASRVHHERDRKMSVEYAEGVLEIDFIAKTFNNTTPFKLDPDFADAPMAKDSLGANVDAFIASVLDGAPVLVPGLAGLMALDAARAVDGARAFGE